MIRFNRLERRATCRKILFWKPHVVIVVAAYFIPRIFIFSKPWILLSHNIILFRVAHIPKRKKNWIRDSTLRYALHIYDVSIVSIYSSYPSLFKTVGRFLSYRGCEYRFRGTISTDVLRLKSLTFFVETLRKWKKNKCKLFFQILL